MKNIKIGWREYEIVETVPMEGLIHNGQICFGNINYLDKTIYLNKELLHSEDEKNLTLLHEVLHGVSEIYYLDMDEELVSRLSEALYTILKDNGLKISKIEDNGNR